MTDYTIKRDRWERPWVTTDGGPLRYEGGKKTPVNATAYTRISTLSGALDDKQGLIDWSSANAAIGVVRSKAIYAQLAHLVSAFQDPWNVPEAKQQLKPLVYKAQQLAGSEDAAGLGTAFHGITELIDRGLEPDYVPDEMVPWLDAYRSALADYEVLDTEVFVVADEIHAAGSVDRLLRHRPTGRVLAADVKTGSNEPDFPLKVMVQVAMGAHGVRYDQATGTRTPLHPDISLDHGLLIHVPLRTKRPRAALYPLDLKVGWELAHLSVRVRELRRMPKLEVVA